MINSLFDIFRAKMKEYIVHIPLTNESECHLVVWYDDGVPNGIGNFRNI